MKKTAAIVLAGGRGKRMGSDTPKQYIEIGGFPLIYYSLKAFQESFVERVVLVCGEGDTEYCRTDIVEKYGFTKVVSVTAGGRERYHSVYNGLQALKGLTGDNEREIVFIHDGARPFVNGDIIKRSYEAAAENHAAVVALPAKDTIKLADEDGFAKETIPRDRVWLMQTPQVFDLDIISDAYSRLIEAEDDLIKRGVLVTDDAMVLELFSDIRVKLVEGDHRNIKVTTPEDLVLANSFLL